MVSQYYLEHRASILQKLASEREERRKNRLNKIREIVLSKTETAYIAGFVDGEGYIGCYPRKDTKDRLQRPCLAIVNTDLDVLVWIKSVTKLGFITKPRMRKSSYKPCYEYRITNMTDIGSICKTLLPYLKVKKEKALLVIEYIYQRLSRVNTVEKDKAGRFIRVLGKPNSQHEKEILQALKRKSP